MIDEKRLNVDDVIFSNDDYVILKKDQEIVGSMMASLDITVIGIAGMEDDLAHFMNDEDKIDIINGFIDNLKIMVEKLK